MTCPDSFDGRHWYEVEEFDEHTNDESEVVAMVLCRYCAHFRTTILERTPVHGVWNEAGDGQDVR